MPVYKFRSVEEAESLKWLSPDDPALWQAMRAVWRRGHRVAPWKLQPRLYRFRDMAEANAQRLEWDRTCVEPLFRPAGSDGGTRP